MFLLIIPGLIAYTAFYIAIPILVLDNTGPVEALKQSWDTTQGHWLAIFGIIALLWIGTTAVLLPFQIVTAILGTVFSETTFLGGIILISYFGVYAQLITSAATVAVYNNI